ncbi:hypothetical protein [Halobacteriovorax sp. DA5]|uniref:hypothetical protein n=1 Tax=Halobacteriovorax sp. DA5 TaxID=2067553 RepID=UPI000CD2F674|nr:hypothetical protein [Halobacteriovorax sp. DA5]POB13620.1 hypothetical protein C0Z22_10675 [Halobacteriovorax sp. DA5]
MRVKVSDLLNGSTLYHEHLWKESQELGEQDIIVSNIVDTEHASYMNYFMLNPDDRKKEYGGGVGKRHSSLCLSGIENGWADRSKQLHGDDCIKLKQHPSCPNVYIIVAGNNRVLASMNNSMLNSVRAIIISTEWKEDVICEENNDIIISFSSDKMNVVPCEDIDNVISATPLRSRLSQLINFLNKWLKG